VCYCGWVRLVVLVNCGVVVRLFIVLFMFYPQLISGFVVLVRPYGFDLHALSLCVGLLCGLIACLLGLVL